MKESHSLKALADHAELLCLGEKDWVERAERHEFKTTTDVIARKKTLYAATHATLVFLRACIPHEAEIETLIGGRS